MNKKQLKNQYIAHCEDTAPDMEKLWERIESGLDEKSENSVTSKPVKTFSFRKAAVWCMACAAVLVVIIGMNGTLKTADGMTQNAAIARDAEENGYSYDGVLSETFAAAAEAVEEPEEEEIADEAIVENKVPIVETVPVTEAVIAADESATTSGTEKVYYSELKLNPPVVTDVALPFPTAEPFGDDFFVEEKVLAETDIIVDAYVANVFYSSSGDTVCYLLSTEDAENNDLGSIIVESASRYALQLDREYVLPLKKTENGYHLVFENAPQIERTLDGGIIFHNGWKCLTENSAELVYPQGGIDDFFYDRMRFSYKDGIGVLDEKWKAVKNNIKED